MFPQPAAALLGLFDLWKKQLISTKTLMPVYLRTARGFRACDANDKEICVFETAGLGIAALLEVATDAT
jgi:hypothetical protein